MVNWRRWVGLDGPLFTRAASRMQLTARPQARFSADPFPFWTMQAAQVGGPVSRREALSIPAVLRGRNLICSIATLPLVVRDSDRNRVRSPLLEQIDPDTPNVVTLAQTVEDLLFESESWWLVTSRMADGFPASAVHMDRGMVSLLPVPGFPPELHTLPSGQQLPEGFLYVKGRPTPFADVIRFDSPNPPLLVEGARTIKRALMYERLAEMFARNPRPQDYFSPADDADPLEDDEVQELLAEWEQWRREHATGYVPAALKYNQVENPSPADLQLVQLKTQVITDIANMFGLDSEDLQVSTTSRTYQNSVSRRQERVNDVLSPYIAAVENRLSMGDVTKRGYTVKMSLDDYLRADPLTRWQTYHIGLQDRVISPQEVRGAEYMPDVPVEPAPQQGGALSRSQHAVFSSTGETVTFRSDASRVFAADEQARTVSGLLLPYNQVASPDGYTSWTFMPGSLVWSDPGRVKMNEDHDLCTAIAYAQSLTSGEDGVHVVFKVARGPEGDRILGLAVDKVYDGFSVEVDFPDGGWTYNADTGIRVVTAAQLVGAAITPYPSFDNARVASVRASRNQEGKPMPDEPEGQQQTQAPAQAQAAPDMAAQFTAMAAQFQAQQEANARQLQQLMGAVGALTAARQPDGPAVVDPTTRPMASLSVNEEMPYRFGTAIRGKYDFSRDAFAALKKDYEAKKRVDAYISDYFPRFGAKFANEVTQSDQTAINYPVFRPDLYVAKLAFNTPIWDAINKGTLLDATPFILPKFNSSGTLVADHTELTEPANGDFTTDKQTITPSPVSGLVVLSREVWDQGGNPQLSDILWEEIVLQYNEALEAAAASLLAGLTLTNTTVTMPGGALTADPTTGQPQAAAVEAGLAALQFVRGGFRFRSFFLEQQLYAKLVAAKDDNGRKLYPPAPVMNASGTADPFYAALNINGLRANPAWALAHTAGSVNKSYLFDPLDVSGWASAPRRLDMLELSVSEVKIGVWGYKATANTRTDSVWAFSYDSDATT